MKLNQLFVLISQKASSAPEKAELYNFVRKLIEVRDRQYDDDYVEDDYSMEVSFVFGKQDDLADRLLRSSYFTKDAIDKNFNRLREILGYPPYKKSVSSIVNSTNAVCEVRSIPIASSSTSSIKRIEVNIKEPCEFVVNYDGERKMTIRIE